MSPYRTLERATVCFDYEPLVRKVVSSLNVPLDLVEDARQEGRAALLQAFDHYNSTSPVSFGTFARLYIRGAVIRHIFTPQQRHETVGKKPIGVVGEERGESTVDFEDDLVIRLSLASWLDSLSRSDQQLVRWLYWDQMPTIFAAEKIGVTPRQIQKRRRRLLEDARTMLAAA